MAPDDRSWYGGAAGCLVMCVLLCAFAFAVTRGCTKADAWFGEPPASPSTSE